MKQISELFIDDNFNIVGNSSIVPTGIKIDSRNILKGDLFFAVKGFESDGHKYIDQAIQNGAVAICCDRLPLNINPDITYIAVPNTRVVLPVVSSIYFGHPADKLIKIGITGTNGKTSTAFFIQSMLKNLNQNCGLIGTIFYDDGKEQLKAMHTTPESFKIYNLFHRMLKNDCRYVVMEVSSHALSLNRVAGIKFERAIFTNFSRDHLDFHKDMDDYFRAKKHLFDQHLNGAAILNCDDELICNIKTDLRYTFGYKEGSDLRVISSKCSLNGTIFSFEFNNEIFEVDTNILGKYNINNILAAMATLFSLGYNLPDVIKSVKKLIPVPGRMEKYILDDKVVIIDYAHTSGALENLLRTCRELMENSDIICVFGCGGDRDKLKRPLMAQAVEKYSDKIIITSDNPRTEEPQSIIDDALEGIMNKNLVITEVDRKKAILKSFEIANTGDLIIIAGKGHEDYQEINKERIHFSDSEIIVNLGGILD